jgi:hypothetical protein
MNRNIAGFYHDPPLWVGSVPTGLDQDPPQDLGQFTQFSENALSKTIAGPISVQVSREGLFSFDFSDWTHGRFPETSDSTHLAFERSAQLMLNQASVMNAFLAFFYSSELKTARFARQRMFVTPEVCPWPDLSPRWWPPKVPTPQSGCSGFCQRRSVSLLTRFLHAE